MLIIYIINYRQRFVQCYTNKILHFGTTTTSRSEEEHAMLKRQLKSFTDNLKTVIDDIKLLLMNEYQNHLINLNEIKMRIFMMLRKSIFQHLIASVISIAMRKILPQYEFLINQSTIFLFCTDVFNTSMRLPCNHVIQQRLFEGDDLLLNDVHIH